MFFKGKSPCVVAGLLASMGLGFALGTAPVAVLAEEAALPVADAAAALNAEVTADQQAVVSASEDSQQAVPVDSSVDDDAESSVDKAEVSAGAPATDASDSASDGSVSTDNSTDAEQDASDDAKSNEVTDSKNDASDDAKSDDAADSKNDASDDAKSNEVTDSKNDASADGSSNSADSASDDTSKTAEEPDSAVKKTEENKASEVVDQTVKSVDQAVKSVDQATKVVDQAADQSAVALAANSATVYKNQWVKSNGSYSWYDANGKRQASGWVVTSVRFDGTDKKDLKRYWIDSTTNAAVVGRLVNNVSWTDKSGTVTGSTYATSNGWVVIGKYSVKDAKGNTLTYLADEKGKLETAGWHVTDKYDNGTTQRYYVDASAHACVEGVSKDGWAHYTTDKGYVARGAYKASNGTLYYADNNGKLQQSGWRVTSEFGQGLQRYWFDNYKVASEGLYKTGSSSWTYVTSKGYVLRGVYANGRIVYLADNNGTLAGGAKCGWVVSSAYGQGLQRYWIDPVKHAAIAGYDDGSQYAGLGNYAHFTTAAGYVLRGVQYLKDAGCVYLGNNDGRLARGTGANGTGWLVTDAYGQGLQRYWIEYGGWTRVGYSESGWAHYTTTAGYVLRGAGTEGGVKRYADNNGYLKNGWVVTGDFTKGALQRYYQKGGALLSNTFFKDGGYWAYAKSDCTVMRGKATVGGKVYLADNNGRLSSSTGWVVTGTYDGGNLQRYYLKSVDGKGYSYAVTGAFLANLSGKNSWFYGTASQGYVVRGKVKTSDGIMLADNDGRLVWGNSEGWKVTSSFDGGSMQRYYITALASGCPVVKTGFFKAALNGIGSWFYGSTDNGYVLRGKMKTSDGIVLANNDGRIDSGSGFIVTRAYDSSVQRYYLAKTSAGYSVAKTGFFTAKLTPSSATQWFYGNTSQGYVVRGAYKYSSSAVLLANQNGVLLESLFTNQKANSWLITNAFAGSTQRYRVISVGGHLMAQIGKFSATGEDGKSHNYYGREDTGFVVRGSYTAPNGTVYVADNDGHLIEVGWTKINGTWYYRYSNGTTTKFTNAAYAAWNAIKNMSSNTGYLLVIDNSNFRVVAFSGRAGNWTPIYDWLCSVGVEKTVGNDHYGRTVRGSYTINKKGTMMGYDPDYYYWSEFMTPSNGEEGQRFHSMGYYRQYGTDYTNPDNRGALYDSGLGKAETHGCVRLELSAVKWIYYTCPMGTKVYSY